MRQSRLRLLILMACCIVINFVGSNLALLLKLPIYLDSIGTLFVAATFGPLAGMIVGGTTGVLVGVTSDLYSLFFMPIQLVIALVAGLVYTHCDIQKIRHIWWSALVIALPGTILSTLITILCFGGITSSGSSLIVQLLFGAGLSKATAVLVVQLITDYADRFISLLIVALAYRTLVNRFAHRA